MSGGAPEGNQNRLALKTPEIRQKAYDLFCAHRAKGKDVKSWWYKDEEGNACTWETMLKYIKENPVEFDPLKRKLAECQGYQIWESIAEESAKGENKANTPSLQMVMRNKFGWDKEEKNPSQGNQTVQVINYSDNNTTT